MAILAVTNDSSVTLNAPETGGYGVSPDAVGGNISNPLPFPFDRNGSLAAGDTLTLAVNPRDFVLRQQMQQPAVPAEEWDNLIQKGFISVAVTANPTAAALSTDIENVLIAAFDT